jgi:ankyrin repeat protein
LAVARDHSQAVQILLDLSGQYIDVNAADKNGVTPLHIAAVRRNAKIVGLLLEAGANPSAQDRLGRHPLSHVIFDGDLAEYTFMSEDSNRIKVFRLLLHGGADVTIPEKSGSTLLHRAARGAETRMIYHTSRASNSSHTSGWSFACDSPSQMASNPQMSSTLTIRVHQEGR